ncbi:MAG: hypothetical protein IH895_01825, partial [Planctomycetes bacterium]|nr:hypothetical protein [Planctomycetota bacterium]
MDAILKDTIERCPAPVCIGLHHIDSSSKPYVVAEIDETVSHIAGQDARERTILLHCVSTYPTAPHDA